MALKKGRLSQVEKDQIQSLHRQKRKIETIANKVNRSEDAVRKVLGLEDQAPKKKATVTTTKKKSSGSKKKRAGKKGKAAAASASTTD